MPGINTSMGTSASMKSLLKTEREMLTAMERISSGKRINNAGDDAAGAAISDRMLATVRALDMSIRNASDVLSMAQVAESAINEHSQALQRIRELSIQAATDILNAEQRIYLQTEANQLIQEMDRVARDTTFNEIAVLDGTFADRRFQIGSHEREKAVISVANMRVDKIGAYQSSTSMDEAGTAGNLASEGVVGANASVTSRVVDGDDLTITGLVGTTTIDVKAGHSAKDMAICCDGSDGQIWFEYPTNKGFTREVINQQVSDALNFWNSLKVLPFLSPSLVKIGHSVLPLEDLQPVALTSGGND